MAAVSAPTPARSSPRTPPVGDNQPHRHHQPHPPPTPPRCKGQRSRSFLRRPLIRARFLFRRAGPCRHKAHPTPITSPTTTAQTHPACSAPGRIHPRCWPASRTECPTTPTKATTHVTRISTANASRSITVSTISPANKAQ